MIGNLKALPIGYAVNVELDVEQKGGGDGTNQAECSCEGC
jgi:hypothetical protein